MASKQVQFITRTAVLLALTLLFQLSRPLFPPSGSAVPSLDYVTYIIGTLVNLGLIVAAAGVNVWSSLIIAAVAPIIAVMQGHSQLPMMVPVMLGNAVVSIGAAQGFKPGRIWIAFLAAPVKYAVIALGMAFFMLLPKTGALAPALATAFFNQLVQLVTAALAVIIALPVLAAIRRALHLN
ncbi:MAG: hypothetical protein LBD02_04735 [Christensenellaceae bacterium]|jgi:hypothetical protein|nr:hypothetical protein [Christensenellaceae bacterium]